MSLGIALLLLCWPGAVDDGPAAIARAHDDVDPVLLEQALHGVGQLARGDARLGLLYPTVLGKLRGCIIDAGLVGNGALLVVAFA